ncbi:ABC transporter substrate-binding protein [Pseudenhygromyxa sp. WMMC2535]|uniref:ABC transporter substrate-binding protein n=1 Tax=Pseudenhygromyxa sp. WMMC2535 TaxID=2712867 RepID=UPI001553DB14|nr:ABC transporter substrate-binding protein [Pseudenhygromyxa sp. WMMC2535]
MRPLAPALVLCTWCSAFVCALSLPTPAHAAPPTAQESFERSRAELIELVDAKAKPARVEAEVDRLLDYTWLAHTALGGSERYAERCADQCAAFEALLTALIRRNYLRMLAEHRKGEVEVLGAEVRERATKIDTRVELRVAGKTKRVHVDYVMHEVQGSWQLRDIITEGVSLARTYRYEIHTLYTKGGMDEVMRALQAKLDER